MLVVWRWIDTRWIFPGWFNWDGQINWKVGHVLHWHRLHLLLIWIEWQYISQFASKLRFSCEIVAGFNVSLQIHFGMFRKWRFVSRNVGEYDDLKNSIKELLWILNANWAAQNFNLIVLNLIFLLLQLWAVQNKCNFSYLHNFHILCSN